MNKTLHIWQKKIVNFCSRHFALLLVIIALISYGQLLNMSTWEDDQALFFKLAHINEPAGYFGAGPFGAGVYRFSAAPFIPIYTLFGFNTTAFFGFLIILYIIATLVVYKTFSLILGNTGGKIAGFLYAAGYTASESIIRMNNSATTSISIILCSLVLMSYWKFSRSKKGKYLWYLTALFFYYMAVQIALVRVHYFLTIIILFEFIFLAFHKSFKSFLISLIRLLPFSYIFYNNYILGGDSRTGEVGNFLLSILHGQFYKFYGLLTSLGFLVIPDWFTNYIFTLNKSVIWLVGDSTTLLTFILIISTIAMTAIFLLKNPKRKFLIPIYLSIFFIWLFYSNKIFNTPLLRINEEQLFIVSLGGVILIFSSLVFLVIGKYRQLFAFLFLWLIGNIFAYSAYFPTVVYDTVNRYLAHSFFALAGILALFYIALPKDRLLGKIGRGIIILLGIGNIYHAIFFQNNILNTRSYPAKQFYVQLKNFLPEIRKGDIVYIDVAPEAQNIYNANISAAMMPDTTAFAWRYGIDRYDFKLTSDFQELQKIISSDKTPPEKVYTFWYSKDGLVDTTKDIRDFLSNNFKSDPLITDTPQNSNVVLNKLSNETGFTQPDLIVNFKKPVKSTVPSQLSLSITASPIQINDILFPLVTHDDSFINTNKEFWVDPSLRSLAFDYKQARLDFYKIALFEVSSDWQERIGKNIHDQDLTTIWQSDRVLWKDKKVFIKIDLATLEEIDRLAWINGFANNTPTSYFIETSIDGQDWVQVKSVNSLRRIQTQEAQIETFSPTIARFVRITITDTIDGDSPSIAELWVIPSKFKNLKISEVERFLENPFAYIPTDKVFENTLTGMKTTGKIQAYWTINQSVGWQTVKEATLNIIYDGRPREYKFPIPARGTYINKIKLSNFSIPGIVTVNGIKVTY